MLLVIVAGVPYLLIETGLVGFFLSKARLIEFVHSFGTASFVGFIVLQVFQVVAAPIPGEITGFLGGYLYGTTLGIFLSTVGLTIGSYAAFTLSRVFGKPFVVRFVKAETLARFDYLLHRNTLFFVFLLFLIPGFPKDYLCYILGLGTLSTKEFLVLSATGRLLGTIMLSLGGSFLRQNQFGRLFMLLALAIILIFVSMAYRDKLERFLRKRLKRPGGGKTADSQRP